MEVFRIEFVRFDRSHGEVLVTLQDGANPEVNSWLKDAKGSVWVVTGKRGSEVSLRPPPYAVGFPVGAKLSKTSASPLRVAHG